MALGALDINGAQVHALLALVIFWGRGTCTGNAQVVFEISHGSDVADLPLQQMQDRELGILKNGDRVRAVRHVIEVFLRVLQARTIGVVNGGHGRWNGDGDRGGEGWDCSFGVWTRLGIHIRCV